MRIGCSRHVRVDHLDDREVASFAVNRHRFPGVEITAGLARHYPQGKLAAHALGYVGRIDEQALQVLDTSNYRGTTHVGKIGIEKSFELFHICTFITQFIFPLSIKKKIAKKPNETQR